MEQRTRLCSSCGTISLATLIEAIPIPSRHGTGCGIPNTFKFSIPQPLSFPHTEASKPSCELCSLVDAQSKTAKGSPISSSSGPLELAALCPPSHDTHDGIRLSTPSISRGDPFTRFGQSQPQWYGFMENEKRVNTFEPVPEPSGIRGKRVGYHILSPWQINVAAEEGSTASQHITRRPLNKQGSAEYFQGISRAIAQCNSDHPKCRLGVDGLPIEEPPELPTRVIDVGSANQSPRLVVSHGNRANYLTLSHCWGSQRWVATTTESLPRMMGGFDLAAIPKTYADAITVTRSLGVQFLWIDSFCIIQDDRDDWAAESQKMGDIYEKAYVNIAAAGAKDGSTGFLSARIEEPIYVRLPAAGQPDEYFYFTNQPNSNFDASVGRVKLNTRGWVLQERLLSRRTIHFAADMWYWECGRHVVSEDGWQHDTPGSESDYYRNTSLRQTLEGPLTAIGKVFRDEDTPTPEEQQSPPQGDPTPPSELLWAQILRAYCKCDLTFASDKLPALQGLVNRFKTVSPSTSYLFGHWLQQGEPLPLSMMWCASTDGGLTFPPELRDTTPTWSCVKGIGAVGFHDTRGAVACTRVDLIPTQTLPAIHLRGRLRTATLALPNGESPPAKPTFWALKFKSETPYGVFERTLGPARFDDAAEVPRKVTLLLAYEVRLGGWRSVDNDQLAVVLKEVEGDSEVTGQVGGDGDVHGGNGVIVPRYKRIGVANVHQGSFFSEVPFDSLVIV